MVEAPCPLTTFQSDYFVTPFYPSKSGVLLLTFTPSLNRVECSPLKSPSPQLSPAPQIPYLKVPTKSQPYSPSLTSFTIPTKLPTTTQPAAQHPHLYSSPSHVVLDREQVSRQSRFRLLRQGEAQVTP